MISLATLRKQSKAHAPPTLHPKLVRVPPPGRLRASKRTYQAKSLTLARAGWGREGIWGVGGGEWTLALELVLGHSTPATQRLRLYAWNILNEVTS